MRLRLLVSAGLIIAALPIQTFSIEGFSDRELYAMACAQYFEIQRVIVEDCRRKEKLDYSSDFVQFQAKYGTFFSDRILETKNALAKRNLSYDTFVAKTVRATQQGISPSFCAMAAIALKGRISHSDILEQGIYTQFWALSRFLPRQGSN